MKHEDLIPFWTVTAQVIPVLALAILIEARAISKPLAKKKYFSDAKTRNQWGGVFLVMAFLLLQGMTTSITHLLLRPPSEEEAGGFTIFQAWTVGLSILAGLLLAFLIPLTAIITGLLGEKLWQFETAIPWSKRSRAMRAAAWLKSDITEHTREARQLNISVLCIIVDIFIHINSLDSASEEIQNLANLPSATISDRSAARAALRKIDEERSEYQALLISQQEMQLDTKRTVKRSLRLQKRVSRLDLGKNMSDKSLNRLRKYLSSAAKA